jgi:hypothetical protein
MGFYAKFKSWLSGLLFPTVEPLPTEVRRRNLRLLGVIHPETVQDGSRFLVYGRAYDSAFKGFYVHDGTDVRAFSARDDLLTFLIEEVSDPMAAVTLMDVFDDQ